MALPNELHPLQLGAGSASAYQIEQSLRFNSADSHYLTRTPSSKGNATTWTWSGWLKLGATSNTYNKLFQAYYAGSSRYFILWLVRNGSYDYLNAVGGLYSTSATSEVINLQTTQRFRDHGAWYHIVFAYDSGNATSSDRCKLYINGTRVTAFNLATYPAQNTETFVNQSTTPHYLGSSASSECLDGYLAEVNFIDGSALTPTDFGEYDDNGVWRPIKYAGSYTGQSWYLKFASGDGTDSSGLSNTWTANNFTTSGTGTDVMSDTPTTNWCTLNPLNTYNNNTSNGNLTYSQTNSGNAVSQGTIGMPSGKWYWEINAANVGNGVYGITRYEYPTQALYGCSNGYGTGFSPALNTAYINSSTGSSSYCSSPSAPASGTYMFAFDADARKFWMGVNGTWYTKTGGSAGDPGAGTNELFGTSDITAGVVYRALIGGSSVTTVSGDINFGQRDFAYTPPTGFKALNTKNLPAPDIADGSQYFDTTLEPGGLVYGPASATSPAGTQSRYYGKYVQDSNLNSSYPAFQWADALNINGKTDWYIPAIQELDIIYSNLKPTTEANVTSDTRDSWNSNPYAVPARTTDYSSSSGPSQTSATLFQEGGSQAFSRGDYYTCTQHKEYYSVTPDSFVMYQKFNNGDVWANGKQNTLATWRAIRRVAYTGSEPAIGESYEGGYFAGLISTNADSSATHALIVAPREYGERGTDPVLLAQQSGFTDALWWVKSRSDAQDHKLLDVVRGNYVNLRSNTTDVEQNYTKPGYSSVVWSWKANGSGSSNTDGTITSTVSANPTAGFSIVSYVANGASTQGSTVGHGLGVAPKFIIAKDRDASQNWFAYSEVYPGAAGGYNFNTTQAAFTSDAGYWNSTAPTSTVFTIGNYHGYTGEHNMIAYCFAEVEGYSKFGTFVGNGSDNGPFVYCGFRPAFVLFKKSDNVGSWYMFDTARNEYNYVDKMLATDSNQSESGIYIDERIDILSNGFKLRDLNSGLNGNTSTFIFVCFAENPFGGTGVSPATAR